MTKTRFIQTTFASALILLLSPMAFSQSASSPQSSALLEIVHEGQLDGGWWSYTTRVFADGHVIKEGKLKRKAKSGRYIDVINKMETWLEAEELAELTGLAERPDFLNAEANYGLRVVRDNPDLTTITFHKDGREKKVLVGSYLISNDAEKAKLPPSLAKILEWNGKSLLD